MRKNNFPYIYGKIINSKGLLLKVIFICNSVTKYIRLKYFSMYTWFSIFTMCNRHFNKEFNTYKLYTLCYTLLYTTAYIINSKVLLLKISPYI